MISIIRSSSRHDTCIPRHSSRSVRPSMPASHRCRACLPACLPTHLVLPDRAEQVFEVRPEGLGAAQLRVVGVERRAVQRHGRAADVLEERLVGLRGEGGAGGWSGSVAGPRRAGAVEPHTPACWIGPLAGEHGSGPCRHSKQQHSQSATGRPCSPVWHVACGIDRLSASLPHLAAVLAAAKTAAPSAKEPQVMSMKAS